MLQNNGPYGPSEASLNMGAPVNMSQLSGQGNQSSNLSNREKSSQQTHESSVSRCSISDYNLYSNSSSIQRPPIDTFTNYNTSIFTNFFSAQNRGTLNGITPTSAQTSDNANMDYCIRNKNPLDLNVNDIPSASKISPSITIPQNNVINANINDDNLNNVNDDNLNNVNDVNLNNVNDDNLNNVNDGNLNNVNVDNLNEISDLSVNFKSQVKTPRDISKRKSLEHTVKLIEDILIHTTNRRMKNARKAKSKLSKDCTELESTNSDKFKCNREEDALEPIEEVRVKEEIITDYDNIASVEVKMQPVNWTDTDSFSPFQKDLNGVLLDESEFNIIDVNIGIQEANISIQDGTTPSGFFQCPHCALLFKEPKRFLIHTKWHSFGLTNERRLELAKEKQFIRNQKREAREMEKINAAEGKKKFPCKDCDKVFLHKSTLQGHKTKYHPSEARECKVCNEKITGWTAMRVHMTTHTADTNFLCPDCPKKFKFAHTLIKHLDTHREKTHPCDKCEKKYGSVALLKLHLKTHERALRGATFRCTYCGKGFFDSYSLQAHERTHRNERPFKCDTCGADYGTNSGLKRHLKVSHSTSKPYECPICHRCFVSESIRNRHQTRLHGDPEVFKYKCKICPSRYLQAKDLRKHMRKVHTKSKTKSDSDSE